MDSVPPPLPSPHFTDGSRGPGVVGFRGSGSLSSLPAILVLSAFLFRGELGDLFLVYFFLYVLFYITVYVFFPHYCKGLLLRGCYM